MNAALAFSLITLFALAVPIGVSLVLASAFGIHFFSTVPLLLVAQRVFTSLDSFPLLAVPLFILSGNLMAAGGISERLVDLAKSMVGGIQGGLACTCVITCMIFASVSGSSVATTFAIGVILIPAMVRHGYPVGTAAAVQASSAELGVLIPPSIPLILYGVATETSIGQLFLAGIGPGLLVAAALFIYLLVLCRIKGYGKEDGLDSQPFFRALRRSFWAILMPFIVLGGIYGGVFTPTEASAVAVVYALVVGMFVYRVLTFRKIHEALRSSAISSTVIMIIIAGAGLFSFLITQQQDRRSSSGFDRGGMGAGDVHQQVELPARGQRVPVHGRHVHRNIGCDPRARTAACPDRNRLRCRSGPFRADHRRQPGARHDHATGGGQSFRRLRRRPHIPADDHPALGAHGAGRHGLRAARHLRPLHLAGACRTFLSLTIATTFSRRP